MKLIINHNYYYYYYLLLLKTILNIEAARVRPAKHRHSGVTYNELCDVRSEITFAIVINLC